MISVRLSEDIKNQHPAELAEVVEELQEAHEDSNVAQAGFHPDFVRSVKRVLDRCRENWDRVREKYPEGYLEDEYNEIFRNKDSTTGEGER